MAITDPKKQELLRLYASGYSVKEIAERVHLSEKTVDHAIDRFVSQQNKHCGATADEVVAGRGCGRCVVCQATKAKHAPAIARRRAALGVPLNPESR